MNVRRVTLLSGWIFLLMVGFVGCSGEPDDVEIATPAAGKGPAQAMTRMAKGLADGRPEVAWQALPPSYRKDVNELVNLAATKMDPEIWNRSFGLVQKLTLLAREKRDFILEQPMLAQSGNSKQEMEAGWDAFAGVLDTLANSDLADLKKMERLDVEEFLASTGSELMQQLAAASALTPDDSWREQMSSLRRIQATVVSESGKTAVVRIERPGAPPSEEEYVQVERHWIPKSMADGWSGGIAEARQKIEQMSTEKLVENKQAVLMQISMVEATLDQLMQTKTREQFNAALAPVMGMAMGAMMAQAASSSSVEMSPGTATRFEDPGTGITVSVPNDLANPSFEPGGAPTPVVRIDRQVSDPATGSHELYQPGQVRFDQAHLYVGQYLRVHTSSGLDAICRLKEARPGALLFERSLSGGSATFEVASDEIESLRVLER